MELSNITQTAAEPVNNGVIVRLDAKSIWTVTGACYLTALHIDSGAALTAPNGKKLLLTVNGALMEITPGSYEGNIALTVS